MKKIGGVFEGLILLAIGAYAALLVFFGDYWRFLNPKFKWLTAATALILIILGIITAVLPSKRPKLSRIIIFILLLRVFSVANTGISLVDHGGTRGSGAESPEKAGPRVTLNGIEYVKINVAELYTFGDMDKHERPETRYAVRGMVKHHEQLDRLGQFALVRNTIFCCLADSVGMGFRVQYDHANELVDGEWVEVYGSLTSLPKKLPDPGLRIEGMNLTVLSDSHILTPDKVVKIKEPEIPFILEIRRTEPYAF
jgi:uncharacterized repeat protein (TIGR03943 family)